MSKKSLWKKNLNVKEFFQEEMQLVRGTAVSRPKTAATGRKRKRQDSTGWPVDAWASPGLPPLKIIASASDRSSPEDELDGKFAFRRRLGCVYQKVNAGSFEGLTKGFVEPKQRKFGSAAAAEKFVQTFLHYGSRLQYAGRVRRRIGRAGRVIFDRSEMPDEHERQFAPDSFRYVCVEHAFVDFLL